MSPDLKAFLITLRRAYLAEVAYIEKQEPEQVPTALKGYFEVTRRSNLQIIAGIERMLGLKPSKGRRQPKVRHSYSPGASVH